MKYDDFIFRYRYLIGGVLIIIILVGAGAFVWQKIGQNHQNQNDQVTQLQQQNDELRSQLANNAQVAGAATSNADQTMGDKININTADLTGLDKITGVGPAIAQRIIDYRNQNGPFENIEAIKNVKGIGDATFEKMKNEITVE